MSKIKNLKNYLKEQAVEIRKVKSELKEYQNAHNSDGGIFAVSKKLSKNYRVHHIAYCLLRGKTYEQIERKCGEDNKLNMSLVQEIKEIKNVYTEDVCISS